MTRHISLTVHMKFIASVSRCLNLVPNQNFRAVFGLTGFCKPLTFAYSDQLEVHDQLELEVTRGVLTTKVLDA